jgi:4'-phosphopantetheinyl transferase
VKKIVIILGDVMIYLYGFIAQCDYECMFRNISIERQLCINKYYFDIDKKRSLFAELLLRYVLERHFSIGENDLAFEKNQFGKPRLSDYPNVFFNYSHSGDWVLCAVGESRVGVDVEVIKERDIIIAKRFFTTEEYEWLQSINWEKRMNVFTNFGH